jgi:hypothetical protein
MRPSSSGATDGAGPYASARNFYLQALESFGGAVAAVEQFRRGDFRDNDRFVTDRQEATQVEHPLFIGD